MLSYIPQHYITVPCLKDVFCAAINIHLFIYYQHYAPVPPPPPHHRCIMLNHTTY